MKRFDYEVALKEYAAALQARRKAVSENAGRRILRQPQIPVPVAVKPLFPFAYDENGDWYGRLLSQDDIDELPKGYTVKWEPAHGK